MYKSSYLQVALVITLHTAHDSM
eukprot:COSAG01_NODE_46960_length_395_cov_0.695946_2_plen_22_part_01